MPRGPRVLRTQSTTAPQALMLLISCALPWEVSVPSRSRMIWGCCASEETRVSSFGADQVSDHSPEASN